MTDAVTRTKDMSRVETFLTLRERSNMDEAAADLGANMIKRLANKSGSIGSIATPTAMIAISTTSKPQPVAMAPIWLIQASCVGEIFQDDTHGEETGDISIAPTKWCSQTAAESKETNLMSGEQKLRGRGLRVARLRPGLLCSW